VIRTRPQSQTAPVLGLALLFLVTGRVDAQEFFERPAFEHRLPQRSALALLIDREDRLWIATREGLARWDGQRMRYWRRQPFDPRSLGGNFMRGLLQDRRGDVWAFNNTGFYRATEPSRLLGPTHERVRRYPFPGAYLDTDPDGEVVLAHQGALYRFDAAADAFEPVLRWSDEPAGISEVLIEAGVGWVATSDGQLWRCEFAAGSCRRFAIAPEDEPTRVGALWRDDGGRLLAGLAGRGVAVVDESAARLLPLADWPPEWQTATVRARLDWRGREVLLSSLGLVWRDAFSDMDCPERVGAWCRRIVPRGDGPADATVGTGAVDAHGVLWVGGNWGLSLHDPRAGGFRHWVPAPEGALEDGWILSLAEDQAGMIWAGSFNGRLYRIDPGSGRVETRLRLRGDQEALFRIVWAIVPLADRLWLGTNSGLIEFNPASSEYRVLKPPGSGDSRFEGDGEMSGDPGFVHALARADDNALWLGTNGGGLWRFDPGTETFSLARPDAPAWINHLLPDRGTLWVASANEGVFGLASDSTQPMRFRHRVANAETLASDTVWMLHRDRRDRLWAGTDSGLALLDSTDQTVSHRLLDQPLPSIAAMSLAEDADGRLWIGTNSGLVRLDPETGALRRFDQSDGLASIEYNRRAALAASDGTLYFGGDRGVVAIRPARIPAGLPLPRARIDALVLPATGGAREQALGPERALIIAPGQRQFGVRLSSSELARPGRVRFQARLAGLEDPWRALGEAPEIFFNRVPPGRYRLEVRATDRMGERIGAVSVRELRVQPTLWQTTWFRALAMLIAAALLAVLSAWWQRQRNRATLQALEQRRALAEERSRISRDMHDEVGSGLTEIVLLGDLAQRAGTPPDDPARSSLRRIVARSRELLDAIGAIVWALNPDNNRLDRLLAFLREATARQCEHFGMNPGFALPGSVAQFPVSASFARHLTLIVREAVTNAGKHADAENLSLAIALEGGRMRVEVADDGCGFDPATAECGNGLVNLRGRAQALGGTAEIESVPGQGTRVRLLLPTSTGIESLSNVAPD